MDKTIVTWRKTLSLCVSIISKLKDNYPNIADYNIVGLSRGGLVPGVIMSNMLNVRRVYALGLQSYENQQKLDAQIYQVPDFLNMQKILIVDDISDTGTSFKQVKEMLVNKDVITVALCCKDKTNFVPDVYGKKIKHDCWVVFPWE